MTRQPSLTEKLLSNLRQQYDQYTRLRDMMSEQLSALQAGNDSRALGIEEEKVNLLREIQGVEKKFMDTLATVPPGEKDSLDQQIAEVKNEVAGLLKELLALDAVCIQTAEQMRSTVHDQIKNLQQSKTVTKNYDKPVWTRTFLSKDA